MLDTRVLSAGVAASLGLGVADADVITARLTEVRTYDNQATAGRAGDLTSSTATWSYDNVSGLLTQTGGTYSVRFTRSPSSTLYRASVTGLVLGNSGPASATTFTCTEGNFGGNFGVGMCGNYSFGANFIDDSTLTYGPGAAVSRVLGGDDEAIGPPQPANLDGFRTTTFNMSWQVSTVVLSNATCTGSCGTLPAGAYNNGQRWTLTVLNAPAGPYDDAIAVGTGIPIEIDVGANDRLAALEHRLSIVSPPDQGGSAVVGGVGVRYVSAPGFAGVETFVYRMNPGYPDIYPDDTATVFVEVVDPATNPDADADGVADRVDNCTQHANPTQCDTDRDGFGNQCDGDLDNNKATNAQDTVSFRYRLGRTSATPESSWDMAADINCNGIINAQDTTLFRQLLGSPPGPSGRVP